ncbi:hypothetical protein IIU_03390 [Bacillus cereus VD133]|uniref:Uncharacterized protein n=1 Tax=Bacillus cereus VD133 TaxID=1053233 RepID=A0A9W5PRB8_BACCE|nr:hypothetical protein [Bacillus cereus]EOO33277.1 hypothetical protein IIU_03390 [Bacillus cereus VD133]
MQKNSELYKQLEGNKGTESMIRPITVPDELVEAVKQIAAVRERAVQAILPAIQAISPVVQELSKQILAMSSFFESIGAIGQRIQETLDSFDFKERLISLREWAKEAEETTLKFKTIMVELGFPPHDFMPIYSRQRVIQLYGEKGIEYTKRFLERYMCMFAYNKETLIEMRNSWQRAEWLEKRFSIINTVIEGHLNGHYMLTVPTMLAQIEGVLVEGILKLEAVAPDEQIKYRHQKSFLGQFLLGDKGSFSFDEQIEEFYLNTVLANFDRGKEVESDLSRHAILHGEDVSYGTKINSLKSILIFDYLFDKLNDAYKDIEESKLEIKRQKEIEQSKKRTRNASGKKPKGYRKKSSGKLS